MVTESRLLWFWLEGSCCSSSAFKSGEADPSSSSDLPASSRRANRQSLLGLGAGGAVMLNTWMRRCAAICRHKPVQ